MDQNNPESESESAYGIPDDSSASNNPSASNDDLMASDSANSPDSIASFNSNVTYYDSNDSFFSADTESEDANSKSKSESSSSSGHLNIMTDSIILMIFKRLESRISIHAFGQTNSRLRRLYTTHRLKIYISFVNRVYSPYCIRLFLLSRSTAMPSITREFLRLNTGAGLRATLVFRYAKKSRSERANIVAKNWEYEADKLKMHPEPQFWTNKQIFRGPDESILDFEGCFKIWLLMTIGLWHGFQRHLLDLHGQPEDRPKEFLRRHGDPSKGVPPFYCFDGSDKEHNSNCYDCCRFAEPKVCQWHVKEDEAFLDNFRRWNESLHLMQNDDRVFIESIGGLTTLFDAYLLYLFFYAKGTTPYYPIFYKPPLFEGCLVDSRISELCPTCKRWEISHISVSGYHFFDYTITETMTTHEASAISFLESRMKKTGLYAFEHLSLMSRITSQVDYFRELQQFSGNQSGPDGRLANLEEVKRGYFSMQNMPHRSFDRFDWYILVGGGKVKRKSIVIRRDERVHLNRQVLQFYLRLKH